MEDDNYLNSGVLCQLNFFKEKSLVKLKHTTHNKYSVKVVCFMYCIKLE